MVQLLLDHGALRSIRNLRFNLTPYEGTHVEQVKKLFVEGHDSFSSDDYNHIEWSLVDDDLIDKRRRFRQLIDVYKTYDNHAFISKLIAEFIHYYLNEFLSKHSNNADDSEDRIALEQIRVLETYF